MIKFAEIRTDYIEEIPNEPRVHLQYVDTWKTDNNDEEGHSVARVDLDTNEIEWLDTRPEYITNPDIILAIADIIRKNTL